MARLIPCKTCGTFRKPEGACPSCGAVHVGRGPTTAALLLGLALASSCAGEDQPLYGDPAETDDTADTDDTDVADTDTGEEQDLYGVAATFDDEASKE